MKSSTSHMIKHRQKPNDVFITPEDLAKYHISMIEAEPSDIWFDPFKNTGNYYNNFPEHKVWCEILSGRDFFEYEGNVDIICSNPPYSILDKVLQKSVDLKPRVISYLIGINNLTTRRIEMMENNGYKITKLHLCKVFEWYGMSAIVVWELTDKKGLLSYDRIVWRQDKIKD